MFAAPDPPAPAKEVYKTLGDLADDLDTPESTLRTWRDKFRAYVIQKQSEEVVVTRNRTGSPLRAVNGPVYEAHRFRHIHYMVTVIGRQHELSLKDIGKLLAKQFPIEAGKAGIEVPRSDVDPLEPILSPAPLIPPVVDPLLGQTLARAMNLTLGDHHAETVALMREQQAVLTEIRDLFREQLAEARAMRTVFDTQLAEQRARYALSDQTSQHSLWHQMLSWLNPTRWFCAVLLVSLLLVLAAAPKH